MAPILINGRAAARTEIGGVERWAREMVTRLPALDPERYEVALPRQRLAHKLGHAWEQAVLPATARRRGASVIYNPAILAPLAWPRNVVSIHDAVALAHPEWYSRPYVAWQRAVLPRIARRALRVITGSEFAKVELVEQLGVPAERVVVIPGGVDERFRPEAARPRERPYVLSVATLGARKNLAALEPLAEQIDVLVAGSGRGYIAAGAGASSRIQFLGYVPEDELPGLYAGAEAFVLPSYHEGLPMALLEAMASGTPVVASDAGALPETVGDAGVLVRDGDFAGAVERLLADDSERARLRAAGLECARALTWDAAARSVHELLTSL